MASYHLTMKNGKSAETHADYITREGKYARGEKAEELVAKEHGNMPAWAQENPSDFWQAADANERANGRCYTEIEIALPNELTPDQREQLVRDFVQQEIGADHVYTWAIHEKPATLDPTKQNPHAHIMLSERKLDGIERSREQFFKRANTKAPEKGGTKKDPNWNKRGKPAELRERWEEMHNKALEREGYSIKVDRRTIEAQREDALQRGDHARAAELDRAPEYHLGPRRANNPESPERQEILAYRETRRELAELQRQIREVEQQIARRDRAAQHIEFVPTKTTAGELLAEANDHKTGLLRMIREHKDAQDALAEKGLAILQPYREAAIDRLIDARWQPKIDAYNEKTAQLNKAVEAWERGDGYGWFERMTETGQYKRDGEALAAAVEKNSEQGKKLAHEREVDRRLLEQSTSLLGDVTGEICRAEPTIAVKIERIMQLQKQHGAEITRLAAGRDSAQKLTASLEKFRDKSKQITVNLPRDGNKQRVPIAAAAKAQTPGLFDQLAKAAASIDAQGRSTGLTARISTDDEGGKKPKYSL